MPTAVVFFILWFNMVLEFPWC